MSINIEKSVDDCIFRKYN